MGLIALSIATLGAGAAAVGIAAGLIGLGFVAVKYFHREGKRRAERDRLADGLVSGASDPDPQARAEAWHRLRLLGFDPSRGVPAFGDVRDRLKERAMSQRTLGASALWATWSLAARPSSSRRRRSWRPSTSNPRGCAGRNG